MQPANFKSGLYGRTAAVCALLLFVALLSSDAGAQVPRRITVSGFSQNAVETALRSCMRGDEVFFPAGVYTLTSTIELTSTPCILNGVRAKSILYAGQGSYVFHGDGGHGAGMTISNLVFRGGGIAFAWGQNVTIDHNVFDQLTTAYAVNMPGGIEGVVIDSNILIGDRCTAACGWSTSFLHSNWTVSNTRITNNWIDGVYQGLSFGGGAKAAGSNNVISNNTILHPIRMAIEVLSPLNNSDVSDNYIGLWRTQDETNIPDGTAKFAQYPGQNPTPNCMNFGNGTPKNRYDCNSFGLSIVGGGTDVRINNNRIYGTAGVVWGAEVVVNSGSFSGNIIKDTWVDVWDDRDSTNQTAFGSSIAGNTSCGGREQNQSNQRLWGRNNLYYRKCSLPGVPPNDPVPLMPFELGNGTTTQASVKRNSRVAR